MKTKSDMEVKVSHQLSNCFSTIPFVWKLSVVWSLPELYLGPVILVQDGEDVWIRQMFPLST